MIINYYPGGSVNQIGSPLRFTGEYYVKIDDEDTREDNWEVYLLSNGNLTTEKSINVDIWMIGGGGGGGGSHYATYTENGINYKQVNGGGGGGSGRVYNSVNHNVVITLQREETYVATIGEGGAQGTNVRQIPPLGSATAGGAGGDTSFVYTGTNPFSYSALGGTGGEAATLLTNGSGGYGGLSGGDGGRGQTDAASTPHLPGDGQGTPSTAQYVFGNSSSMPLGGGGAGGAGSLKFQAGVFTKAVGGYPSGGGSGQNAPPHSGAGGGGGYVTDSVNRIGAGGSGLIVIRNHRITE